MAATEHTKIGLLSPCGWGNLGDAAIQQAMIHHIRQRIPGAVIYGFTLNPEDTEKRHHIPCFAISTFSTTGYRISTGPGGGVSGQGGAGGAVAGDGAAGALKTACKRRLPWLFAALKWQHGLLCRARDLARTVGNEVAGIREARNNLAGFKFLIVSGGGQLDDFWGGAWGHPYALFKWSLLAKVTKTKVLFLSVGMSSLDAWLSRLFVRGALSLAEYRSYRDKDSKKRLGKIFNCSNDPVLPDLAFSLPVTARRPESREVKARRVVGVSPISYKDPRTWPVKDQVFYDGYVAKLASFITWLITHDFDVVLFASNKSDFFAIGDVKARLAADGSVFPQDRVFQSQALAVDDLLSQLTRVDYVVASRLHGVILSHMLSLPVLALAHDPKVCIHMDNVNQSSYLMDIENFDIDTLVETFHKLEADGGAITTALDKTVNDYADLLDKQYSTVLS